MPPIASPTDAPTMAPSANGVSKTRSPPKCCCNPCVTRNTPPSVPTSIPNTRTRSWRAISAKRAARIASRIDISSAAATVCGSCIEVRAHLRWRQILEWHSSLRVGRGLNRARLHQPLATATMLARDGDGGLRGIMYRGRGLGRRRTSGALATAAFGIATIAATCGTSVLDTRAAAGFTAPTWNLQIGQPGSAFVYPWGMAWDPVSGTILTSDYNNYQVKRFGPGGRFVGSYSSKTALGGNQPYGVAVDPVTDNFVV